MSRPTLLNNQENLNSVFLIYEMPNDKAKVGIKVLTDYKQLDKRTIGYFKDFIEKQEGLYSRYFLTFSKRKKWSDTVLKTLIISKYDIAMFRTFKS